MTKGRLAQFEQQIAHLIEGSIARLFANRLHPHEVASRLARAMDENVRTSVDGALIAPNVYIVRLNPEDHAALTGEQAALAEKLAENVIMLASSAEMRLLEAPSVDLRADESVPLYSVEIGAYHVLGSNPPTESMEPVTPPPEVQHSGPRNPQLVIQGTQYIPLDRNVINIGRRKDNHIVINDPRVSRAHAQLRLRFDHYLLYDLGSKAGTYVNGHRITECILRSGDVISLAGAMLVYLEDDISQESRPVSDTQIRPPNRANSAGESAGEPGIDPTL